MTVIHSSCYYSRLPLQPPGGSDIVIAIEIGIGLDPAGEIGSAWHPSPAGWYKM